MWKIYFFVILSAILTMFDNMLSLTPTQKDGHHPILLMHCGSIWYRGSIKSKRKRDLLITISFYDLHPKGFLWVVMRKTSPFRNYILKSLIRRNPISSYNHPPSPDSKYYSLDIQHHFLYGFYTKMEIFSL